MPRKKIRKGDTVYIVSNSINPEISEMCEAVGTITTIDRIYYGSYYLKCGYSWYPRDFIVIKRKNGGRTWIPKKYREKIIIAKLLQ